MYLNEAQQQRMMQLNELDKVRQDALQQTIMVQQQRIKWHNKFIRKKEFQVGDWDLLFDSKFKYFKGKFTTHWLGPYEIQEVFDNGSVRIKTIDEEEASFLVNGHKLKVYNKPLNRDEFVSSFCQDEIQILGEVSSNLTPLSS